MMNIRRRRCLHLHLGAVAQAVLLIAGLNTFVDAEAQNIPPAARGALTISDWPEYRTGHEPISDFESFRLLPFIDSLTMGYRFTEVDDRATMEIAIEWMPGDEGILDGRRVERNRLPEDVIIESIDLLARVEVDGQGVAEFYLPLDTLRLRPSPSVALVDVRDVDWNAVFAETDGDRTRSIFRSGFSLRDLRILRVVFATGDEARADVQRREPEWTDDRTTVFVPDVDIWIGWRTKPRWHPPVRRVTRADRDRRDEIGRPDLVERDRPDRGYDRSGEDREPDTRADEPDAEKTEGRKTRRKGEDRTGKIPLPRSGKDDDDDDDEDRLLPAALAGAAIVGGLAVLGGTFGYMGNYDSAPIGLMAGRVTPRGGVLIHVAVNEEVFGKASGPENLVAGITGFADPFRSPIQPALGLGVRVTEEGSAETRTLPSVAVGVVANLNRLVLHVAYDIEAGDVRFGIGLNFRAPGRDD